MIDGNTTYGDRKVLNDFKDKIANIQLAVLAKGRTPPPVIEPQYVFGAPFPF